MRDQRISLTPDKRCPLCRADYDRFRSGLDFGTVAGELGALDRAIADSSAMIRDADARTFRGRAAILGEMSARKRAAWDAQHGPGRCFPDVWTPVIERVRASGPITRAEQDWQLRELIADLILDDEDNYQADESVDVDVSFNPDDLGDGVPVYIDDGQATSCIAA